MSDEACNGECLKCENLKIYIYIAKKKKGKKWRDERAVTGGKTSVERLLDRVGGRSIFKMRVLSRKFALPL